MCLILFSYQQHPHYPFILAANRDEFYSRPTAPAGFWSEFPDLLGGRDLQSGGTWLGVTRQGRIAALTNFREPLGEKKETPSRGLLVRDFLQGQTMPLDYLQQIDTEAQYYSGFNLLVGDAQTLCYYSNRGKNSMRLSPGLYGLSNHLLDTPWPKVQQGKTGLHSLLATHPFPPPEMFFDLLSDPQPFADELLPNTGVGLEMERLLSPLHIATPIYGTRASTVLLKDTQGTMTFIEKTLDPSTMHHQIHRYEFQS